MVSQPQVLVCHLILFLREKLSFVIHCKVILRLQGKQRKRKMFSGWVTYELARKLQKQNR